MATVELDPQFIKALRLLRSKSKDSGAQLRAMLDDAIRQKKGLAPRSPSVTKPHSRSVSSDRERSDRDKKKDLDRLKKDLSELVDRPSDPKRARLDSPALSSTSLSHSPSPTSISPPPKDNENSNSASSDNMEYGDLEMNLEFDCSCCVCKSIVQESGNSLMECNTCQNLYHQVCHNPPVSNEEAKDPRLIWNCMKCTKEGHPSTRKASVEAKCTSVQITSTVPNLTTTSAAPSAGSLQYLDYGHQLKKSFPPLPLALDLSSKVTSASTLGKSKFHDALSEESGLRGKEAEGAEKLKLPKAEKSGKSSSSSTVPGGSGSVVKSSTTSGKVKESRHGTSLKSAKSSSGSSANSSSSSGASGSEMSSSAKKRLKFLKKQAAASTIVKKKTSK